MKRENKTIIEVKNLRRNFKTGKIITNVLKGLNFKIKKGEFVGIMGPSGSGKSTVLHQLGLLDTPSEGEVIIDEIDVTKLNEEEKTNFRLFNLGYVFQQYRLIPELSALENVYLPLQMKGENIDSAKKKAKELLDIVNLSHRYDHLPSEMSGGEQQRIAIARSLINEPMILFADEPTANLDTNSSDEVLKLFKKFNEEMNQTIIMVSHEPEQIKYFDRVIHIVDGNLDSENYKHPQFNPKKKSKE